MLAARYQRIHTYLLIPGNVEDLANISPIAMWECLLELIRQPRPRQLIHFRIFFSTVPALFRGPC
jgi:hypothetical protein